MKDPPFLLYTVLTFSGEKDSLAVKTLSWTDVRKGKRLPGGAIFKSRGSSKFCELFSDDVFSSNRSQFLPLEHPDCLYHRMTENSVLKCNLLTSRKSMLNDEFCQMPEKKLDIEWGPWEPILVDLPNEFKEGAIRQLIADSTDGGTQIIDEKEQIQIWVKYFPEKGSWEKAKHHCEQIGGKLFSNLDGTADQIDFFVEKFNFQVLWLGIYRRNSESTEWITTEGKVVPDNLLLWNMNENFRQPDLGSGQYALIFTDPRKLHNASEFLNCSFCCDMS